MSHSVGELYSVYANRPVRARKDHACSACGETIEPGHVYHRVFTVFEGETQTVKRCLRCELIHEHLRELEPGETWPNERLNCGERYEDEWGEPPPEEIAAPAFLSGGDLQGVAYNPHATPRGERRRRQEMRDRPHNGSIAF